MTLAQFSNEYGFMYEGDAATLSGSVSNLDGAALTVTINWGDGSSDQPDQQVYYLLAGESSFTASHVYMLNAAAGQVTVDSADGWAWQTFSIGVTANTSDIRTATESNAASISVADPGPTVLITSVPSGPVFTWPDPFSATATAYEAWNPKPGITYEWATINGQKIEIGDQATCSDIPWGALPGVVVYATDANGATAYVSIGPYAASLPAEPTVSISETDPNQMVFEGDRANFKVQLDQAVDYNVTVFYNTVDPSSAAPTA